jgi:P-type E1-E2 ATPase
VRKEQALSGLGVTAVTSRGVPVVAGRRQLLLDEGISVATADHDAKHIENEGLTPIFIAIDGNLEALVAILDPTHVGAQDAVQRITDLPCEVVILSGDDRRTVERIAAHLGASRVKAPLLPRERVTEVRALRDAGGVVAAIGRGGEDDAVLAAADVPISLRLVGTALEERGIVVASHDVRDAAGALWIARAAKRSTWRSVAACLAVTALVIVGASLTWMTPVSAALLATATDAWALRAGSRLLRRVDLRVPTRQ